MRVRAARGIFNLGLTQGTAHGNVVAHAGRQQKRFLRNQADFVAKFRFRQSGQCHAIQFYPSGLRAVKTQQQTEQRRFAAAGVSHDAVKTAGPNLQINIVEHRIRRIITKADVVERDTAALDNLRRIRITLYRFVQQGIDARGGHHGLLNLAELHRDLD